MLVMLSDLIDYAQSAIGEYGDMPVLVPFEDDIVASKNMQVDTLTCDKTGDVVTHIFVLSNKE